MEISDLRVAVTGAGGFIGSALSAFFKERDCSIIPLSRKLIELPLPELAEQLQGVDIVVNLAGAPIIGRWTLSRKQTIYESRILTTRKLADAILSMEKPPAVFISASAVGIYSSHGIHAESSEIFAGDFLGNLCHEWENEALRVKAKTRVLILRTGVVLSKSGGALAKMLPIFRSGLGGIIASGDQGFSWIHLRDLINAIGFLILSPGLSGIFNLTAPQPVDNRKFTQTLAGKLKRRAILPVPGILLKVLYGEGAITLTEGQKVVPQRLLDAGYVFEYQNLENALDEILLSTSCDKK